ncbi:nucleoside triphosphate pyrophosphohydrolase [Hahella sp. KA22]|uniref:nucleoside triphosphate pyrophosphohydrolase n=1 Tax=Hahella sp. KA22 TaxID=1628392 RepID=UPI000FDE96AE|nr:nucleoside triphosphate pyrophosphohydrolase [Hahella sp. KA22]AZZ93670.1 nucleoside triphosphate pyrophosphohydrolase [Hahella sp. KA22]QAY57045.1 nucleoside triphosphate pyrophosphohydrolase [Hahella sp. KA22]
MSEKDEGVQYTLEDLLYLMRRLRDPKDGCPWDIKQDFASIVPFTIEETYEVADAIEREDWPHLRDELGDLLFQAVFYSQMAQEKDLFQWPDIVDGVVRKLLRRHPHVFPDGTLESRLAPGETISEEQIKANWERIKQQERELKKLGEEQESTASSGVLADIPNAMPALQRAQKLQKRASLHGFDWPEINPVLDKIHEEIEELRHELAAPVLDQDKLEDELGDVLFCCVNLARFVKADPEAALRRANAKFIRRFSRIESLLQEQGKTLDDASLQEMDLLWDKAKEEGL